MTTGKTTIEFSHDTISAVSASLDALTLAIAWAPEGSPAQDEPTAIQTELRAVRKRWRNDCLSERRRN